MGALSHRAPADAAASERREPAPHLVQSVENRCVDRLMYLRPQPALPHEGGEQPHDLRGFDPEFGFGGHCYVLAAGRARDARIALQYKSCNGHTHHYEGT